MTDKSCFTWERGTKIFAYFNLVLVILCSLIAYAVAIHYIEWCVIDCFTDTNVTIIFALLLLGPIISTTFAIILFVGVKYEKPKFLLTYIIYGIMVILLSFVGSYFISIDQLFCIISFWYICEPPAFAAVLLVCAMYSLILIMIGKTKFPEKKELL